MKLGPKQRMIPGQFCSVWWKCFGHPQHSLGSNDLFIALLLCWSFYSVPRLFWKWRALWLGRQASNGGTLSSTNWTPGASAWYCRGSCRVSTCLGCVCLSFLPIGLSIWPWSEIDSRFWWLRQPRSQRHLDWWAQALGRKCARVRAPQSGEICNGPSTRATAAASSFQQFKNFVRRKSYESNFRSLERCSRSKKGRLAKAEGAGGAGDMVAPWLHHAAGKRAIGKPKLLKTGRFFWKFWLVQFHWGKVNIAQNR